MVGRPQYRRRPSAESDGARVGRPDEGLHVQTIRRPLRGLAGRIVLKLGDVDVRPLVGVDRVPHDGAATDLLEFAVGLRQGRARRESEPSAIGREAERTDRGLMGRHLPRFAAVRPDSVHLPFPAAVRSEREPFPGRVPDRGIVGARPEGELAGIGGTARCGDDPDVGLLAILFHVPPGDDVRDPAAIRTDRQLRQTPQREHVLDGHRRGVLGGQRGRSDRPA